MVSDSVISSNATPPDGGAPPTTGIPVPSPVSPGGFNLPAVHFETEGGASSLVPPAPQPVTSVLASAPAIATAEMIELSGDTGKLLYYPVAVAIDIGDVFFLRERDQGENGIIVQVIKKEAATYAQADTKTLWRLLTQVRAHELHRAHHEPAETIDLFLSATFKVRAAIVNGKWESTGGRVVTRNVDIFSIAPKVLTDNILVSRSSVNVHLGDFKAQPVIFSGQGFDKVNLITGMKGVGKSHIAKGIINESQMRGMSAVVFDINDEYESLPHSSVFKPGLNLKFRLDRIAPHTFLDVIEMLAPFAERTRYGATVGMDRLFAAREGRERSLDINFLVQQADIIFPGTAPFIVSIPG